MGRYYRLAGQGSVSEIVRGVVLPKEWWPQGEFDHVTSSSVSSRRGRGRAGSRPARVGSEQGGPCRWLHRRLTWILGRRRRGHHEGRRLGPALAVPVLLVPAGLEDCVDPGE